MCTYSMVHDFAREYIPTKLWDNTMLEAYKELIRRLKEIDDKLNLPDCNPNKGEFLKEIEEQIREIDKGSQKEATPKKRK